MTMKIRTFRIGGIHPEENKLTHEVATQVAPLPKQAVFPLSQHIGAPAKPVVAKGDVVKVGTLLAEAGGFVSAPIYSSVSGKVAKIDSAVDASGYRRPAIIVSVEGDEWEESIDRSDKLVRVEDCPELTPESIVEYQEGRRHRYGWCRIPHIHQTMSSSRSHCRVCHHQCCGM